MLACWIYADHSGLKPDQFRRRYESAEFLRVVKFLLRREEGHRCIPIARSVLENKTSPQLAMDVIRSILAFLDFQSAGYASHDYTVSAVPVVETMVNEICEPIGPDTPDPANAMNKVLSNELIMENINNAANEIRQIGQKWAA